MCIFHIDEILSILFQQVDHYRTLVSLQRVNKRFHRLTPPLTQTLMVQDDERGYVSHTLLRGTKTRHGVCSSMRVYDWSNPYSVWREKRYVGGKKIFQRRYQEFHFPPLIIIRKTTETTFQGKEEDVWTYTERYRIKGPFLDFAGREISWENRTWRFIASSGSYSLEVREFDSAYIWRFDSLKMGVDYAHTLPDRSPDEVLWGGF